MVRSLSRWPRLFASAWFGITGAIFPILWFGSSSLIYLDRFIASGDVDDLGGFLMWIVAPWLSASISGFIIGPAILDSGKCRSLFRSFLLGMGVALSAYVIFSFLFSFISMITSESEGNTFLFPFLESLYLGLLGFAWFFCLIGGISGMLLYLARRRLVA